MKIALHRLILATLASLAIAACSTQPTPIITAPSTDPSTRPPMVEAEPVAETAPEPRADAPPPTFDEPAFPDAPPGAEEELGREGDALPMPNGGRAAARADDAWQEPAKSMPMRPDGAIARRPRPESRPGLATQWGESRDSRVSQAAFERADDTQPFALGRIFYNDRSGIHAMLGDRPSASRSRFPIGSGFIEVSLRSDDGRPLPGYASRGEAFIPGVSGDRYSIAVRNLSPGRVEIVASVDGLDVVDGRPAALTKRGYIVEPWGSLEIDGFRTSSDSVASFRFGSVSRSYAARKYGDTRNVGVIGIAAFHQRGDSPWRWAQHRTPDTDRRLHADPFPMRFSSPP